METIQKRTMPSYVILNILTLGIYGLIVNMQMGKEVDMICEGDNELEISYLKAWLLGIVTGGIYLNYWWYRQANRLKVNGYRYGLEIRESGLDIIMYKMFCNIGIILMIVIQYLLWPGIFIGVFGLITEGGLSFLVLSKIINFIIGIVPCWSFFGYLGIATFIKNLNRFADVAGSVQPAAFDPMEYEYYPAKVNEKDNRISGGGTGSGDGVKHRSKGRITGTLGANIGYSFDLCEGEELIIGKDPSLANVIIPASYRDVSRKHCGIIYDSASKQYRVIDYSSNGTFINGRKRLASNTYTTLKPGTIITLATTDNTFRLD